MSESDIPLVSVSYDINEPRLQGSVGRNFYVEFISLGEPAAPLTVDSLFKLPSLIGKETRNWSIKGGLGYGREVVKFTAETPEVEIPDWADACRFFSQSVAHINGEMLEGRVIYEPDPREPGIYSPGTTFIGGQLLPLSEVHRLPESSGQSEDLWREFRHVAKIAGCSSLLIRTPKGALASFWGVNMGEAGCHDILVSRDIGKIKYTSASDFERATLPSTAWYKFPELTSA